MGAELQVTSNMRFHPALIASLLFAYAPMTLASDYSIGAITVTHPRARTTSAGQSNASAYMTISNRGDSDRLVGIAASVAASAELHEMRMDGSVMRMRETGPLELPHGRTVELKPGSYHVMLLGLTRPLKAGQHFSLTLHFEKAGRLSVEVEVESPSATQ
jgi:copper(I)-binding protein